MRLIGRRAVIAIFLLGGLITGCASSDLVDPPSAILRVEPWHFSGFDGDALSTRHYIVYTTISDQHWRESFAALMEGALAQYRRLAPDVPLTQRPMECYVFETRDQWAAFTTAKTGTDASIYLHIARGGYTVRDWFVAFYFGPTGTLSVAAHEGFHQFAARHFKTRIPPFLEEGIACMFENVEWDNGVPVWNLDANPTRVATLQIALAAGKLIPLDELITLHAGQLVNGPRPRMSIFYAESWAFARFLWAGEHKKFRPQLRRLLTDAAAGKIEGDPSRPLDSLFWKPSTAKPLLERYLATDLNSLNAEFLRYLNQMPEDDAE